MRINKYLATCELGSRRKVEEFILNKEITVNDNIINTLSYDVKDDDIVKYKGKDKKVLEWNTILYEHDKLRIYNVFNNAYFSEAVTNIMHTPNISRSEISEVIMRKAQWQFWGRCEYEHIISSWPPYDGDKGYKIDIFEQLTLNWDRFIDYIMRSYGKL